MSETIELRECWEEIETSADDQLLGAVDATPSSRTGLPRTQGQIETSGAFVDYLSITFPDDTKLEKVMEIFAPIDQWKQIRGAMGYFQGYVFDNIRIYCDGMKGMGIHVVISGKGCRYLEQEGIVQDWLTFLLDLKLQYQAKFARLDIAVDETEGYLDFDLMLAKLKNGNYTSLWRKWAYIEDSDMGRCLRIGSRGGRTFLRIYNKAAQMKMEDKHWIRVELELRKDDTICGFLQLWKEHGLNEAYKGILKQYFNFRDKNDGDSNRRRWNISSFWTTFLGEVHALSLCFKKPLSSLLKSLQWLDKQCAVVMSLLMEYFQGDLAWFFDLIEKGNKRQKKYHRRLLEQAVRDGTIETDLIPVT